MKLEFEVHKCLCKPKVFRINGGDADSEDFGESKDLAWGYARHYGGCDNRQFISKAASAEVLVKYGINAEEYARVCEALCEGLSFGRCGYCM